MSTPSLPAAAPAAPVSATASLRHGLFEDVQALFTGTLFVGIAMMMFAQAGLLTGSTAGLAFVLHYATGWPFGLIFFAINIPFYWFAWTRVGRTFTVKTFICVGALSLITEMGPRLIHIDYLHPAFAAIAGGLLMGSGLLFLARHRSSLGGATIASLYLQDRYGIRVLFANIEDYANNETRFAVISNSDSAKTGHDKTAIMFQVPHKPGSLVDILELFKSNKINLTWIESFPYRQAKGEYVFFVDFEGHHEDPKIKKALQSAEKMCESLSILGSFPMAKLSDE